MIIDRKEKINGKHVVDYFVSKFDSGIYEILFNTHKRWIHCHQASDEIYMFQTMQGDWSDEEGEIIEVPEFLPQGEDSPRFMSMVQQNKDQIVFYFVPFELVTDEDER